MEKKQLVNGDGEYIWGVEVVKCCCYCDTAVLRDNRAARTIAKRHCTQSGDGGGWVVQSSVLRVFSFISLQPGRAGRVAD